MNRRVFLGTTIGGGLMAVAGLNELLSNKRQEQRMPALFIGHGSPMNAITDNTFTRSLSGLAQKIPTAKAILVVSAHWMTQGTWVTKMARPKTIHDFYGFPKALFDVQYPAPGAPEVADEITSVVTEEKVLQDSGEWGLDHGTWSILKHMYPRADIPVLQLSLNMTRPHEYHFQLGQQLAQLRERGVLIIGSGNIVHNLRQIQWQEDATPYDWAVTFDEWCKDKILKRDFRVLQTDVLSTEAGRLAVPTVDHYLPLHYILGAVSKQDEIRFEFEGMQNASISMRTFSVGL